MILCGNLLKYTLIFSNIKYSTEIFINGYCIHSYVIKLGDFNEIKKPTPQKLNLCYQVGSGSYLDLLTTNLIYYFNLILKR